MDWSDVLKVIGALGGIATVSAGVAAFVGNLVSSRIVQAQKAKFDEQLETHKDALVREADRNRLILKRQEMLFEREYTAAADFFRLFSDIIPEPWAPDLDWADAQMRIAESFFSHEKNLRIFLGKYSACLSGEARRLLESAKSRANEGGFEVAQETVEGEYELGCYPSDRVCKIVDQFHEALSSAEKKIRDDLRTGSFIQDA